MLGTYGEEEQNVTLVVEPFRTVNVTVKLLNVRKSLNDWSLDPQENFHGKNDQTLIILDRESIPGEEGFTTFAEVYGDVFSEVPDQSEDVKIIPGNYSVRLITLRYDDITFPIQERCEGDECFFVPQEPIIFDEEKPFPAGGAEFEWELTKEELDSGNTIEFKTISIAIEKVNEKDRDIEDLEQIGKIQEYTESAGKAIFPKVTR